MSILKNAELEIRGLFNSIETIPASVLSAEMTEANINPDSIYSLTRNALKVNDIVFGVAMAFEPNYFPSKGYYFSPYSFRGADGSIATVQLGSKDYSYFDIDWYLHAKKEQHPVWTKPYYDEGGGEKLMITYATPFETAKGFAGVLTADVLLDRLINLLNSIKPCETAYAILLDEDGSYLVNPDKKLILNETIYNLADKWGSKSVATLGKRMTSGESGFMEVRKKENEKVRGYFAFYTPLKVVDAGWSVALIIPREEVLHELHVVSVKIVALFMAGIALLFLCCLLIVRKLIRPLRVFSKSAREIAIGNFDVQLPQIHSHDEMKQLYDSFLYMQQQLTSYIAKLQQTTASKERIDSELRIAREIQTGMVPKTFPPFPARYDIDIYAELRPAKEVGGDLYDFFICDSKLYFLIGDVSGKGVPASLLMAVTRSIFRSVTLHLDNPAEIASAMNDSIVETNDLNMFVTLFIGILDLETGRLSYCNAGHNPPILISASGSAPLSVKPNIPAGVLKGYAFVAEAMQVEKDATLFLYTDGLTEAENSRQELFTMRRLLDTLKNTPDIEEASAKEITNAAIEAVHAHVEDAQQSDDLTILAIKYCTFKKELVVGNDLSEIAHLAAFVESVGEALSLPPKLVMNFNLALEEAVTNIIQYAYDRQRKETIEISAHQSGDMLTFTIRDSGREFDITQAAPVDTALSAAERAIGGLGIHLIKNLVDKVEYSRVNGKNMLRLKKKLKTNDDYGHSYPQQQRANNSSCSSAN
jgi:sigma-B regulation protein RsbU (phosphoserine phosphatase)